MVNGCKIFEIDRFLLDQQACLDSEETSETSNTCGRGGGILENQIIIY